MLDINYSQYDYAVRHEMLQREYRASVLSQRALVAQIRHASNQIGAWLVKVGEQLQTEATTAKLQGQS